METTVAQLGFGHIGCTVTLSCPATGDAPFTGILWEVTHRVGDTCWLTFQGSPHPVVVIVEHATGTTVRADSPEAPLPSGGVARSRSG
ncbi:hypothetical protein GTQ99_08605 [Kineococcus sp. T13]|uniref:hypothetical protein n=1 Tax=Kineococcus vitellinus TaxID=2696565 RepID=UPI001412DAE1|nr:hypothetical protein [Kineococcus vitellinus]NAZ75481.1 hypothetical protein [Kineococcus vitellinus]